MTSTGTASTRPGGTSTVQVTPTAFDEKRAQNANPALAVYLQRYLGGGRWQNVTSKALSSSSGYSFTIKPTWKGTLYYRVYKPADTDHLAGYSAIRNFKVY